ncbi:MAG: 2-oxo acid dehydrogenase subunit E2 [Firmicutes bacterium]|nr:2-oxo acid dehydrogenase subunit E2 [Bacillota bacterium]
MATKVIMPKLGLTMTEGTIVTWLKHEGDPVEEGEPLVEIMTDKVTMHIESPAQGILAKILRQEGDVVPITEAIAVIAQPGEDISDAFAPPDSLRVEPERETAPPTAQGAQAPESGAMRDARVVRISPAARLAAKEHGLGDAELLSIKGTGPDGRIVRHDVEEYVRKQKKSAPPESGQKEATGALVRVRPLSGMRKSIFEHMAESKHTAAHVTLSTEVDMTDAVRLREQLASDGTLSGLRSLSSFSYTSLIVKAVASAIRVHPDINCRLAGDGIEVIADVNIGVAVDVEEGLIVPVIKHADRMTLLEIDCKLKDLAAKARAGNLTADEVTGGTFTVTNLGMYGVEVFTPIINLPECAILGIGRITQKPAVWQGGIAVRSMMHLSLSFDHRLVDGAPAARFLGTVKELLERPCRLLL